MAGMYVLVNWIIAIRVRILDRETNQLEKTTWYHSIFAHSDFKLFTEARMKKCFLLT